MVKKTRGTVPSVGISVAVNIIPSPTACAGNLNQKAGSLSYFQTVGARNTGSTDLSTALDGKAL